MPFYRQTYWPSVYYSLMSYYFSSLRQNHLHLQPTAPMEPQFSLDLCEWVMIRSTDPQLVSVRCTSEHVLFLRWIFRAGTCNVWWINGLDLIRGDGTLFVFMKCGLWFQMGSASVFSAVWERTSPDRRCWDRCGSTETNEKLLLLWFRHILL